MYNSSCWNRCSNVGFHSTNELAVLHRVLHVHHEADQRILVADAILNPDSGDGARRDRDPIETAEDFLAGLMKGVVWNRVAVIEPEWQKNLVRAF